MYYPEKRYEPSLYVLDYLEMGNPSDIHYEHRNQPLVQGIGTKYFSLLEATPLIGVRVEILEKVDLSYPSKLRRIIHISYNELTSMSRTNLPEAIRRVLHENEKVFVEFFNIAEPINIRLHSLELLPDIGKKTMNAILDARRQRRFASFDDVKERVGIDPVKALIDRIVRELVGGEKYYLFIRPRDKGAVYLGYLERLYGEAF
jgi:putative nucleotide binding protein